MQSTKEISALLRLIDDPDREVYDTVANKLLNYGKEIIPTLEQLWEITEDEAVQERIKMLIHRVHFEDLQEEFVTWSRTPHPELLRGAILLAKFQNPDLNVPAILTQFDQLRRNIWLELNNYLTPVEQINVFNSILYNYFKLHGNELTDRNPNHFSLDQVFDTRQGNSYTIGILFLALCEMLDIPVFAVDVPRQFIFAYIDTLHSIFSPDEQHMQHIQFYVDPINGMIYTQKDVDTYLKKINAADKANYLAPMSTKRIMYRMMEELALCYNYRREEEKAAEIKQLMKLIIE